MLLCGLVFVGVVVFCVFCWSYVCVVVENVLECLRVPCGVCMWYVVWASTIATIMCMKLFLYILFLNGTWNIVVT